INAKGYINLYGGTDSIPGPGGVPGGKATLKVNDTLTFENGGLYLNYGDEDSNAILDVQNYVVKGKNTWDLDLVSANDFKVQNLYIGKDASVIINTFVYMGGVSEMVILPNVYLSDGGMFSGAPSPTEGVGADVGNQYTIQNLYISGADNTLVNVNFDYGTTGAAPQSLTFDLTGIGPDDKMLVLGENATIDFKNKTLEAAGIKLANFEKSTLKPGDTVHFLDGEVDNLAKSELHYTDGLETWTFVVDPSSGSGMNLVVETPAQNSYVPYFEGVAASLLVVSEAATVVDEAVTELTGKIIDGATMINVVFHGGFLENKTGSKINANVWGLNMAAGHKIQTTSGSFTFGGFVEGGGGSYDTHNTFPILGDVKGNGKASYIGGGLFISYLFNGGTWFNLAGRFGSIKNEFDVVGHPGFTYDTSSDYYGFNVSVGQNIKVQETSSFDIYAKLFWTQVKGKSLTDGRRGRISFESSDSSRTRLGGRYTHPITDNISGFFGLAWEYEFSGKSVGTYINPEGLAFRTEAPSLKGSSAFGEIGLQIKGNENVSFMLRGFGLAGQNKGGGGTASLILTF
ncbi:MAG: autotransporter outer membrane beta-barrel domain-containing protein, partial [Deltaproteobacteria bacterium]|nr:autotransporter outer membrane beta-barrel domain-containing protein [Deltaproteobacteria bacterium]